MGGKADRQAVMLTAITPDALAPQGHPIWRIKPMVYRTLAEGCATFDRIYADDGRASTRRAAPVRLKIISKVPSSLRGRVRVGG